MKASNVNTFPKSNLQMPGIVCKQRGNVCKYTNLAMQQIKQLHHLSLLSNKILTM